MEKVFSIEDVRVVYSSGAVETVAVEGVSFDVYSDSVTIILGQSGCGKTSLLNVIGGMKSPTAGRIMFHGDNIGDYKDKQLTKYRKDEVGFIFQNYNLIASLTALENVNIAAALSKGCKSAVDMLELVGLADKKDHYPRQMSGGEQQRVCIARALVKNARLLLCDEPTGALDTYNSKNIICILQKIAKEMGIPVVIVTHNLDFLKIADHYIVMENGIIIEEQFNDHPANATEAFG